MKFNLSDKECNILTEKTCNTDMDVIVEKDEYETRIILHNGNSLFFKKGFFKEDVKEFIKLLKKKATKRVYLDFNHKPCKLDNGPVDWAYCGGCGRFVIEEGCTCGTVTLKDIDELTGEI